MGQDLLKMNLPGRLRPTYNKENEVERTTVATIFDQGESLGTVKISGWLRSIRNSKKFSFLVVNDGSTHNSLQVIADQGIEGYECLSTTNMGASMEIEGKIVPSQGKGQSVEMQASKLTLICNVDEDYPLQKKATSLEFLREKAHLRSRTNTFSAVFRVRNALAFATHKFFNEKGYLYVNTPLITAMDAEGAGNLFRVSTLDPEKMPQKEKGGVDFSKDFFERPTYLAVTGQLEAELFAMGLGNVYTFGPTFRAENSNTPRHLAEFWMIEPEVAFADLHEMAAIGAEYVQYMVSYALEHCPDELEFLQKREKTDLIEKLKHVVNTPVQKVSYTDAIGILEKADKKFEFPVEWGMDLQTEHERYLAEVHFNGPVIVHDYPKDIKAFYMRLNEDGKTVAAMDLLVPGVGELFGGSQREERLDVLRNRIRECGLNEEEYWWYVDLRRHGSVVHSGFGLGFERAVMYVTGMTNIRDVIPFPRTPGNAEF